MTHDLVSKWGNDLVGEAPRTKPRHLKAYGDHKFCGTGDTTFLLCHVTSRDHVRKESCDFVVGTFGSLVPTPPSLFVIDIVEEETALLICHVISSDNVIKGHMT